MNRALLIKNWREGGNNYILKGNSESKWIGYQESVIKGMIAKFGDDFNIVIWSNQWDENDYYCIPFARIKHLFVETNKTSGKYPNRWTSTIVDHRLFMKGNNDLSVDITEHYSKSILPVSKIEINDDHYIENAKAEISIRLGQSKFRKGVLTNFHNKCALTGIRESNLIVASHIVPWAQNKSSRGDYRNGICFYVELDSLFDKGYFSLNNDLIVIITERLYDLSDNLRAILLDLKGKQLSQPKDSIKEEYLEYHREEILIK